MFLYHHTPDIVLIHSVYTKSIQMKVERSLRVVAVAEEKLVELQKEKEKVCMCVYVLCVSLFSWLILQLESVLQRVPRQGGRVTKHSKQG